MNTLHSHKYKKAKREKMLLATKLFTSLCFLAIIMLEGATPTHATVRRYKFELRYASHTMVCHNKKILTINGQFPGPTIYATRGDLVIIDVINRADQNITIHMHGVKNPRNPWSDGPVYVTQCPISPGTRFTQRIILSDEEGTLWWHAHMNWARNSVYGALVILPPDNETYPFPKPHAEVPIILGEWWNDDVLKVLEEFHVFGSFPRLSDAFYMNGLPGDLYPCSKQDTFKLSVEPGKTYLFRMINNVMSYIMFFKISNHTFTVVATDGAYTKPFTSDYIVISPGQTIDFLMEANQPPSRYYMASRPYHFPAPSIEYNNGTATAYVEYVGSYTPPASPPLPSLPFNSVPALHDFTGQFRSLANSVDVPVNVTEKLFYTLSINLRQCVNTNCTGPYGDHLLTSVNNVTMVLPDVSFLEAYYYGIKGVYRTGFPDHPPHPFDYAHTTQHREQSRTEDGTGVRILEYNATVELVFQGTKYAHGMEHPMHLHGYSFYVVGWGYGNFNRSTDPANYNLVDPPLMQTITVPRNGWLAIRFKANNPGVWMLHCHFDRHMTLGMIVVFIVKDGERPVEKMLPPPSDMPRC